MMSENRINGLRELAKQGIGGEKQNAINILKKLGISIEKPKETVYNRVKSTFGGDIRKTWSYEIKGASDTLFILSLIQIFISPGAECGIKNNRIQFKATESQNRDILGVFSKHRTQFNQSMFMESEKYINSYLK